MLSHRDHSTDIHALIVGDSFAPLMLSSVPNADIVPQRTYKDTTIKRAPRRERVL